MTTDLDTLPLAVLRAETARIADRLHSITGHPTPSLAVLRQLADDLTRVDRHLARHIRTSGQAVI